MVRYLGNARDEAMSRRRIGARAVWSLLSLCVGTPAVGQVIPGDIDSDSHASLFDFANLQRCVPGPGGLTPECQPFDPDGDGNADLTDNDLFTCAFGGPDAVLPVVSVDPTTSPTISRSALGGLARQVRKRVASPRSDQDQAHVFDARQKEASDEGIALHGIAYQRASGSSAGRGLS